MKKYWLYFKYILEHKKNVFLECRKVEGMFWHGITHDLSKFSPKEFKAYAWKFYGKKQNLENIERNFQKAWKHHYTHNKHHWNYWIGKDIPINYIEQMLCDWKAMSKKFGNTVQEFYIKNYNNINLTWRTRMDVEYNLNLNDSEVYNYGHTLEQFANMYDEETYNSYFGFIKEKYKVNSYILLKHK